MYMDLYSRIDRDDMRDVLSVCVCVSLSPSLSIPLSSTLLFAW